MTRVIYPTDLRDVEWTLAAPYEIIPGTIGREVQAGASEKYPPPTFEVTTKRPSARTTGSR